MKTRTPLHDAQKKKPNEAREAQGDVERVKG
jgi:hypothetical protein